MTGTQLPQRPLLIKSRGLLKTLTKIEEEDIQQIDVKIQEVSQQMEENKERRKTEVSMIQRQYNVLVEKLDKVRKQQQKVFRDDLARQ